MSISKSWLKVSVLALLTLAGGTALVGGCSSTGPGTVEIGNSNPFTGESTIKLRTDGQQTRLPANYQRRQQRSVPIIFKGRTFTFSYCIAEDQNNPSCIYINSSCGNENGWTIYCEEAVQERAPQDDTGDVEKVEVVHDDAVSVCKETGSIDHNPLTGNTTVTIINCTEQPCPTELVDCIISDGRQKLSSDDWSRSVGSIPAGATIHFSGSEQVIAWNSALLGRTSFTGVFSDAVTGLHEAHGRIVFQNGAPPVCMVIVDGKLHRSFFVTAPR